MEKEKLFFSFTLPFVSVCVFNIVEYGKEEAVSSLFIGILVYRENMIYYIGHKLINRLVIGYAAMNYRLW